MSPLLLLLLACTRGDFALVVDQDDDGYPSDIDCDDTDAAVNPAAEERCDGVDNDCDGAIDDDDTSLVTTEGTGWYADTDSDGYGAGPVERACVAPDGFTDSASDCDDTTPSIHPNADELCDGVDNDCNTLIDDQPSDGGLAFVDSDGDGVGGPVSLGRACEPSPGVSLEATDCDDDDANVFPGAQEVCGGGDEDCDGAVDDLDDSVDEDSFSTLYLDADGDGAGSAEPVLACAIAPGRAASASDCDDDNPAIHPAAQEVCNQIDDDCDSLIDDEDPVVEKSDATVFYPDLDADGYGDGRFAEQWCAARLGLSTRAGDCDDTTALASPEGTEVCDGRDNNCDGLIDELLDDGPRWQQDTDGDGYGDPSTQQLACEAPSGDYVDALHGDDCDDADDTVHPHQPEQCNNGLDDNCDGTPSPCGLWGEAPLSTAEAVPWPDDILELPTLPLLAWDDDWDPSGGRLRLWDTRSPSDPDYRGTLAWEWGAMGQQVMFTADLDGELGPELYAHSLADQSLRRVPLDPGLSLLDQAPYSDPSSSVTSWISRADAHALASDPYRTYATEHAVWTRISGTSSVRVTHSWPQGAASASSSTLSSISMVLGDDDIDGDGQWDLLLAVTGNNPINTAAVLGPLAAFTTVQDADATWEEFLELQPDVDADGRADLSWIHRDPDPSVPGQTFALSGWTTIRASSKPQSSQAHTTLWYSGYEPPVLADFDGDGSQDALLTQARHGLKPQARLLHGPLSGDLSEADYTGFLTRSGEATVALSQPLTIDLDGDGRADLLAGSFLFRGAEQ